MTDQFPPPDTATPPKAGRWFDRLAIVAIIAWAITVGATVVEFGSYASDRDIDGISAPQVAQIAGEFLAGVAPFVVVACAITAAAIMSGLRKILG